MSHSESNDLHAMEIIGKVISLVMDGKHLHVKFMRWYNCLSDKFSKLANKSSPAIIAAINMTEKLPSPSAKASRSLCTVEKSCTTPPVHKVRRGYNVCNGVERK
jgi:hypothetical protein